VSSINIDNNNNSKKSDFISTLNQNESINVAISNDSGIHEDSLDTNFQTDVIPKSTKESFQLPSWLANNQPIPDELLAKRSVVTYSTYQHESDDDDIDYYQPSAFYGFSFMNLSVDSEDAYSVHSLNTPSIMNTNIRDEIKTCVDTLHTCLSHFREMNEQSTEEIDENIVHLLNDLIDQIENSIVNKSADENLVVNMDMSLDFNLLNELFTKKLTFNEYLLLLDRLIENNLLNGSSKTGEDLFNDILSFSEQIEEYQTKINIIDNNNEMNSDNQYQSSSSVISFLQQSTSMDISLLVTNDSTNQTSSQQQQTSTHGGKTADVGRCSNLFNNLEMGKNLSNKSLGKFKE
jgi:hypothetical protein